MGHSTLANRVNRLHMNDDEKYLIYLIGKNVVLSQQIEYKLKWCLAYMTSGNPEKNYKEYRKFSLGEIIKLLEETDYSLGPDESDIDKKFYLSLKQIKKSRNSTTHNIYIHYLQDKLNIDAFIKELEEREILFNRCLKQIEKYAHEIENKYQR